MSTFLKKTDQEKDWSGQKKPQLPEPQIPVPEAVAWILRSLPALRRVQALKKRPVVMISFQEAALAVSFLIPVVSAVEKARE